MASSPSSPIASLPPQSQPSGSPPPMASSPSTSQSNVISSPPPLSPPVISTAPPPSPPPLPTSLSPASPPPLPPPPSAMPPLLMSPPPPLDVPLPTPTLPPPPPTLPSSHPPSPSISPPPPVVPRTVVPPPSPSISPPPPVVSPRTVVPPPSPPISPPPPGASWHTSIPPPPPSPPISSPLPGGSPHTIISPPPPSPPISPPPPTIVHHQPTTMPLPPPTQLVVSPISSPPPPTLPELPHSRSQTPPSNPLAPQLRVPKPTVNADSPPSPAGNSSRDVIPLISTVPSLPTTSSPIKPDSDHSNPTSPAANRSSSSGPDVIIVPGSNNSPKGTEMKSGIAAAVVLVSLLVLCLVGVVLWFVRKNRKSVTGHNVPYVMPSSNAPAEIAETYYPRSQTAPLVYNAVGSHGFAYSPPEPELGNSKSLFTYEELYKFTGGFSSQNLLGEGGFGCVYKGYLPDGREVAVKQLKVGGDQGEREFKAEVEIINRIHHRHLVSLVGYCIAEDERLLVYAYVPNNTLYYHLHGEGGPVMDWATRVKVAAGSAHGLAYLHEDCHPRIIHRDIKSSNILLDNNFEAQVSDFGLARLALDAHTHVTTRVVGTFGYLAPEYASSGKLTDKSDVYSFGVVLLELITGRKPVDTCQPIGDESLVEWARPLLTRALDTGDFQELPDPRLEQKYNETEMLRMIEAAAACTRHSAAMRPRMGQVVRALDNLAEFGLKNGIIPGQSELFSLNLDLPDVELFQSVMPSGSQPYLLEYSQ